MLAQIKQSGVVMFSKFPVAALAGAAGAVLPVDQEASAVLLVGSGLAGVIGMLYDRRNSESNAVKDFALTFVLAFVLAAAFGGPIGDTALARLSQLGMDNHYRTAVAAHIGGGLLVGIFMRATIDLGKQIVRRGRK